MTDQMAASIAAEPRVQQALAQDGRLSVVVQPVENRLTGEVLPAGQAEAFTARVPHPSEPPCARQVHLADEPGLVLQIAAARVGPGFGPAPRSHPAGLCNHRPLQFPDGRKLQQTHCGVSLRIPVNQYPDGPTALDGQVSGQENSRERIPRLSRGHSVYDSASTLPGRNCRRSHPDRSDAFTPRARWLVLWLLPSLFWLAGCTPTGRSPRGRACLGRLFLRQLRLRRGDPLAPGDQDRRRLRLEQPAARSGDAHPIRPGNCRDRVLPRLRGDQQRQGQRRRPQRRSGDRGRETQGLEGRAL